jgi:RimJ/RimL family protein N-acetyltransferase
MVPADLDDLAAVLGAPDPARPGHATRTRDDTERWIAWNQHNYRTYGFGLWVVETHDGRFVGDCGLTMQDLEGELHLEVGYHVALDLRGQGLATGAAAAVRRAAAEAGEPHLVAIVRPDNLPSQRVAQKIGLRLERRVHKGRGEVLVFGADLQAPEGMGR